MRILVVDDHIVVREGLRRLLKGLPAITILEAEGAPEALGLFRREHPDVVVLDLNLAGMGGLELLRRLLIADSSAKVLVFSMHSQALYAARALKAGARGYVSKSAPADELVTAVKRVAEGGRFVEREIAVEIAASLYADDDPLEQLSAREVEILRLLGEGKSLAAIAEAFGVAYKTIANSCSLMKNKLGVERTADLIRLSVEMRRS